MDNGALDIPLSSPLEPGSAVYKTFCEALPYYLGGDYGVAVDGDVLRVSGAAPGLAEELAHAAHECLLAAQSDHERVQERVLQSFDGAGALHDNVYEDLEARGWVMPTGTGKVAYADGAVEVFQALDNFFLDKCLALGARHEIYPHALEGGSLLRAGYFDTLGQHAYFVAPLKTELQALAAARDGSVLEAGGNANVQVPQWVLSPTVCHHCFEARRDGPVELPLKVTAINHCSRFEVHDTRGLQRLRIYWMREFIQFDRDEQAVVASLDELLATTTSALERWGVSHTVVTASDPFFSNSATSKRAFQSTFALKRELRLPIPGGSVACASFNNHQRSLVKAFNIDDAGQGEPTSGCVGWGYDRFMFALFCQLGTDLDKWPSRVRDDLGL